MSEHTLEELKLLKPDPLDSDIDTFIKHVALSLKNPSCLVEGELSLLREAAMVLLTRAKTNSSREEAIEAAYWEFDARMKGYGEFKGRQQTERDAFKWTLRGLVK